VQYRTLRHTSVENVVDKINEVTQADSNHDELKLAEMIFGGWR
jgi:hypothetical protein